MHLVTQYGPSGEEAEQFIISNSDGEMLVLFSTERDRIMTEIAVQRFNLPASDKKKQTIVAIPKTEDVPKIVGAIQR